MELSSQCLPKLDNASRKLSELKILLVTNHKLMNQQQYKLLYLLLISFLEMSLYITSQVLSDWTIN